MYEKISEIIFNYSINNKYADEKFIRMIIDIVANERNLAKYISDVSVIMPLTFEKNYVGSHYNMETMQLCIDRSGLLKSVLPFNYNILLFNSKIAITILHELDHTKLNKQIRENSKNSIDISLTKIIEDLEKEKKTDLFLKRYAYLIYAGYIYKRHHDEAPFERRANITSLLNFNEILTVLNETSLSKRNLDLVNLTLLRTLIKKSRIGYKIVKDGITNSPSYDYITMLKKQDELHSIGIYDENRYKAFINAKEKYSLNERILYGLPLSKEEYQDFDEKNNPFNAFVLEKRKKI